MVADTLYLCTSTLHLDHYDLSHIHHIYLSDALGVTTKLAVPLAPGCASPRGEFVQGSLPVWQKISPSRYIRG